MAYVWEYRIPMPMTVEEYHVAQLWSVAEASKNETGGGEGLEVCVNEPFDSDAEKNIPWTKLEAGGQTYTKGQYTKKIYHLKSKVPGFIRVLAPKGALEIYEDAWNAYPYCRTVITNPEYMKENFRICIESFHAPDRGDTYNIHNLSKEILDKREVVKIDIADNEFYKRNPKDYKEEWDPSLVQSQKTGRGPLKKEAEWSKTHEPIMCCYKLVTANFKWFGLQNRVQKLIMNQEKRIFTNFHRQVFCWMDKWHGLTMEDIRHIEEKTKHELDDARKKGTVRGTATDE